MSGYIGTQPVPQATQTRDSFTATSGQTSFATGGYTPNFLDVYLNGVKLSAADYTASNGSDVVLASGAATGDILEVVAYTTFTVGSSFTPSIDDNGNATAMTIDSDERVLIGQTTASSNTVGTSLRPDGRNFYCADGNYSAHFNRKSSDGAIAHFAKDDTVVGSIGVSASNNLVVGSTSGSHAGITFGTNTVAPMNVSNFTNADDSYDLGNTSSRWQDLYLSGGVYLGGTGSANKLDDVETGTFALNNAGDGSGVVASTGKYIKIGRQVTVHAIANVTTNFTSQAMDGLPFAPSHVTTFSSIHGAAVCIGANVVAVNCNNGTTRVEFRNASHAATAPTTGPIRFTLVYQTT